jgi:hypothetical protein
MDSRKFFDCHRNMLPVDLTLARNSKKSEGDIILPGKQKPQNFVAPSLSLSVRATSFVCGGCFISIN